MSETRTKNSFKNIIFNNTYQLLNIILNFVIRTIFIKSLGESYLGLNGLFTNILSILSLAEMGISTAMLYSMYKPIANSDEKKLAALIGYYKILYTRIALVVLAVGLVILPLLPYLLSFAAGAMIYVVVEELLPESVEGEHSNITTIGFALGFMIMMILDVALG